MAASSYIRPPYIRVFILVVITIAYAGVFSAFYHTYGSRVMPLSSIPVILAGWWFGFLPALGCAAIIFVVNTAVIAQTFTPRLVDVIEVGGTGAIALVLIGGVTGKLRDLSLQLKQELQQRIHTEEELRQHRANLEDLISARTSELEGAVHQLRQEIAERKQIQEELKQSLEKEKRLNQLKSRFTSMVSHEFRTPLTVIQSCAEILSSYSDRMDEAKKAEKFHTIETQVNHMVELLGDILALDRAETVGPMYNPQPLDLAAYCRAIVDEFEPTAKTHRLNVIAMADAGLTMIDEALMRRAIWNLLSNAVKYSPAGTPVEVCVRRSGDQAVISVKDYGIGVPEADRKDLFEIFHRAHNVGSIQGTGLGLPIVKQAVLAHGGSIDFESEIGVGTTFTIKLPRVEGQTSTEADNLAATA